MAKPPLSMKDLVLGECWGTCCRHQTEINELIELARAELRRRAQEASKSKKGASPKHVCEPDCESPRCPAKKKEAP